MKKNKKLLTRMMTSVMAGMLLFGQVRPAFAQDTAESEVVAGDKDEIGKLEKIEVNDKDTPYYTFPDGTYYYPTGKALNSLKEAGANVPWTATGYNKVSFKGWDDEHVGIEFKALAWEWAGLAEILQLNSGLANISAKNGLRSEDLNGHGGGWSTLKQVEEDILAGRGQFNRPEFKRAFQDENKQQYIVAAGEKYRGNGASDGMSGYVVAYLYNFRYTPMLTDEYLEWAVENKAASVEDNITTTKEAGLGCYNDTPALKTDKQHVETDVTQSSTKGDNGSIGAALSITAKMSVEGNAGVLKVGAELGYTASASFSTGWSKSESTSYSNKSSAEQSITLPPFSGVNLVNSKQNGTYRQTIDFPLIVSYDVKLVSYGMAKSGETAKNPQTVVMATYEGRNDSTTRTDAQSDLFQRYFKDKEDQNVKYKGDAYPFDVDGLISILGKTAPYMTVKKTYFDGKVNDRISTASNFIAMHPLRSVDTTKEMRDLKMKPGTTYQGRDIPVFGYLDKKYADLDGNTSKYSTFNRERGHWELKSGKGVIEITVDDQRRQQIKALKEGEATIIYRIDENCYDSNEDRGKFTVNDALESTAELTITVSKTAVENTEFINQALHALENDGNGWTADDGYILGSEDGEALTDAAVPVSGLDGIQLEAKGNALDSRDGLESVQYNLTGENADKYDVYYRSYVKDLGWMNWASNDQLSGTSGYDKEITAVQVMILEKDITPTADDSVTPAFFMENTDNSDPAVLFPQMKAIHEEYAMPAQSVITYSTDGTDEESSDEKAESSDEKAESGDEEAEPNDSKEEGGMNDFFNSIGDTLSNLFNPDSGDK